MQVSTLVFSVYVLPNTLISSALPQIGIWNQNIKYFHCAIERASVALCIDNLESLNNLPECPLNPFSFYLLSTHDLLHTTYHYIWLSLDFLRTSVLPYMRCYILPVRLIAVQAVLSGCHSSIGLHIADRKCHVHLYHRCQNT